MLVLDLPQVVLWQICMIGGASALKTLSESCAKREEGKVRNVITADKQLFRQCFHGCATFAKFRDALLTRLPEGYRSKTCKNVNGMSYRTAPAVQPMDESESSLWCARESVFCVKTDARKRCLWQQTLWMTRSNPWFPWVTLSLFQLQSLLSR